MVIITGAHLLINRYQLTCSILNFLFWSKHIMFSRQDTWWLGKINLLKLIHQYNFQVKLSFVTLFLSTVKLLDLLYLDIFHFLNFLYITRLKIKTPKHHKVLSR